MTFALTFCLSVLAGVGLGLPTSMTNALRTSITPQPLSKTPYFQPSAIPYTRVVGIPFPLQKLQKRISWAVDFVNAPTVICKAAIEQGPMDDFEENNGDPDVVQSMFELLNRVIEAYTIQYDLLKHQQNQASFPDGFSLLLSKFNNNPDRDMDFITASDNIRPEDSDSPTVPLSGNEKVVFVRTVAAELENNLDDIRTMIIYVGQNLVSKSNNPALMDGALFLADCIRMICDLLMGIESIDKHIALSTTRTLNIRMFESVLLAALKEHEISPDEQFIAEKRTSLMEYTLLMATNCFFYYGILTLDLA